MKRKNSFTSLVKPNGFTLAETMLVVIILGVIAVLVVPQLIRRQVEVSNRTKLKKAMAAYDYLMNRMILENDLHSNTSLKIWGSNCSNSANYFKISQETSDPCVFKTTDGVWWNIENIQQPMVAFKQDDLDEELAKKTDNNKAFYFVAHYDDQGIIRISDNAYEVKRLTNMPDDEVTDGDKAMEKLFGFVKNKKGGEAVNECVTEQCKLSQYRSTSCENFNGDGSGGNCTTCISCVARTNYFITVHDDKGRIVSQAYNCTGGGNCSNAYSYTYDENNQVILFKGSCNNAGIKCSSCEAYNGATCVKNSHGYYDPEDTDYNFEFEYNTEYGTEYGTEYST